MSAPLAHLAALPGASVPLAPGVLVLLGDVLARLADVASASVHCIVTSPPYWGLRDYGIAPTAWPAVTYRPAWDLPEVTVPAMTCALGLEPDLLSFIAHLVLVFRKLARVLRPDGCCWMNLGDSYATGTNAGRGASKRTDVGAHAGRSQAPRRSPPGLPPKNLLLQPHRAALALQADGWVLRQDDVWEKPSPVPESVTDRTTRAHEYVFQLARGERYFYDASAVAEPAVHAASRNSARTHGSSRGRTGDHRAVNVPWAGATRNPRSVWRLAAAPFKGAHFATFPPGLPRRCILAGTSEKGCCPSCGAPWRPVVEKAKVGPVWNQRGPRTGDHQRGPRTGDHQRGDLEEGRGKFAERYQVRAERTGWSAGCACPSNHLVVPCVVLDPFAGSGTTLAEAHALNRHALGVDAQPDYVPHMHERMSEAEGRRSLRALDATTPIRPRKTGGAGGPDPSGPLFAASTPRKAGPL